MPGQGESQVAFTPQVQGTTNLDVGGGLSEGMHVGAQLALHKQQLDQQQQQLESQHKEHMVQVVQKQFDTLKRFPEMTKEQQKMALPGYNSLAQLTGTGAMGQTNLANINAEQDELSKHFSMLPRDVRQWSPQDFSDMRKLFGEDGVRAFIQSRESTIASKERAEINANAKLNPESPINKARTDRIDTSNYNQMKSEIRPIQQVSFSIDKGLNLLNKPKVTYGEAKEALIDYSRALTSAGSSAYGREQGLESAFLTQKDKINQMIGRYITNNPADETVGSKTLALLKEDFDRLASTSKKQYETVVRTNARTRPFSSEMKSRIEKEHGVFLGETGQPSMNLTPSTGGTPPGGANTDSLRQQAQAAISAGKDPNAVKTMFKQKTGQEL